MKLTDNDREKFSGESNYLLDDDVYDQFGIRTGEADVLVHVAGGRTSESEDGKMNIIPHSTISVHRFTDHTEVYLWVGPVAILGIETTDLPDFLRRLVQAVEDGFEGIKEVDFRGDDEEVIEVVGAEVDRLLDQP